MKNIFYCALFALLATACSRREGVIENQAVGYAQGSTYQIKYLTAEAQDWQYAFDSIFRLIDNSMSTYQQNSLISALNRGETRPADEHFSKVYNRSVQISQETDGSFDPTVGPLVQLWGFGKEKTTRPDSAAVDSVLKLTGWQRIRQQGNNFSLAPGSFIDFNAIAQGYTVDLIAGFLQERGVERYMVEVGGELRCKGLNASEEVWRIGVDKPSDEIDEEDRFQFILALKNAALATSGNYRKFWVDEETGLRYAHTIDPKSGFPARNQLLSVSVIAPTCMDADAYATACMVMGTQKAYKFIQSKPELEAYFISTDFKGDWEVLQTAGFEAYLID